MAKELYEIRDNRMVINGVEFEVKRRHLNNDDLAEIAYSTRSIYNCYDRPSDNKRAIYKFWHNWYCGVAGAFYFGITSFNTFSFSLACIIEDAEIDGLGKKDIVIRITPTHNYAIIAK